MCKIVSRVTGQYDVARGLPKMIQSQREYRDDVRDPGQRGLFFPVIVTLMETQLLKPALGSVRVPAAQCHRTASSRMGPVCLYSPYTTKGRENDAG